MICGYFYTGFIDLMLKGKILLEYKNLFSRNDYDKNDKIVRNLFLRIYFKRLGWEKSIVLNVKNIKNLKTLKYNIFAINFYFFLVLK